MIDAIVDACDAFAGVYIAASFPEYDFGFLYPGCTECGEEGAILVTLGYSDTAGTCGTNYPTGVMLDYDTCFSAFHNPIDGVGSCSCLMVLMGADMSCSAIPAVRTASREGE